MHVTRSTVILAVAATMTAGLVGLAQRESPPEWSSYGGDQAFTRYAPLDGVNRDNVRDLRIVWRRPAVDPEFLAAFPDVIPSENFRSTPIVSNGVLYAPNGVGLMEAFDAATGRTVWTQELFASTLAEAVGDAVRGAALWRAGSDARLVFTRGQYLYALDAKTGRRIEAFGDKGRVLLNRNTPDRARYFSYNGPLVVRDVVIIGGNGGGLAGVGYGDDGFFKEARPEDIRGYDVRSGALLWTFNVVPQPGQPGHETWGNDSWRSAGNLAAWSPMTADEELGYAYVPLTAPTSAYYGGWRPGANLYSNSLVALDAKSGRLVWHFQMVHHDLWEFDNVGPPILGDITVEGRRIKAVMQPGKTGFLYVFDRVTGKPVWPIEERPVPPSSVPGEQASPTQPFPTKPAPFDLQTLNDDDLIDFTPELRREALAIVAPYVRGPIFTPPSVKDHSPGGKKGTLVVPGYWGAGNWNTGAFDPETGVYYAISHTIPSVYDLVPAPARATMAYNIDFFDEVDRHEELVGPKGLPLTKPPYGRITAIDMNRGEHLWVAPTGDGPRDHPAIKHLNLPPLGVAGRTAPLLTKSLLFLGEATDSLMRRDSERWTKKFRAFDKTTGALVSALELPASSTGSPMTYVAGGRQFIVVGVSGKDHPAEWIAMAVSGDAAPPAARAAAKAANLPAVRYNAEQAAQGEKVYRAQCGGCHGQTLKGGSFAPGLGGASFARSWSERSVRRLYSRIISTMPPSTPGTLASSDVIGVVQYLLRENGAEDGGPSLERPEQLNSVKMALAAPQP